MFKEGLNGSLVFVQAKHRAPDDTDALLVVLLVLVLVVIGRGCRSSAED